MRGDPRIVNTTSDAVLDEALAGAKKMYDAVRKVYGPTSFNVALQKSYGSHVVTHDGVTVAKDVILRNQDQNIGADELYKASRKTDDISGDGTSMTVVFGFHAMEKARRRLAAGYNPMALRRGIRWAGQELVKKLDELAVAVPDEKLHEIATISSNDPEIGQIVADTVIKAGGVGITVEEYDGLGVLQDVIEGLYFEKGWALPHFVNNAISEEVLHEDIHVLCLEKRIRANQDIVPILEMIYEQSELAENNGSIKPRVLIIGNLSDKALRTCVLTDRGGAISICVVDPPVFGSQVLGFMEDVAAMTGGKVVPESMPAGKVTKDYLGLCERIIVGRTTTTIIGSKGDQKVVEQRIADLKTQLDDSKYTAPEKERMERRLAKLQGKIGIIRVGGAIDTEREETLARVRDAVYATRGAKEDGIVPGGGTTLARLSRLKPSELAGYDDLPEGEQEGVKVVLAALAEPLKQLMINAGESPDYRFEQVLGSKAGFGFNLKEMTDKPIDLLKAGVIDPVRVLKSGVENGCSVAGTVITLGATLTIDRDFQLEQIQLNKAMMGQ
jgi:chaperonin GroEL